MAKYTAKPFVFDADKYRQDHRRLIAGVGGKVDDVFTKTAKKIAKIGLSTGFDSETEEFKWSDYPTQQKQAQTAINGMYKELVSTIEQGQVAGWDASNLKNDDMVQKILPTTKLPKDIVESFMPRNAEALQSFQQRKVAGMNLSQRIWSFKQQSEREFEMALDVALGTGKSAAELSRDIRLALKEPNNLFRRVRDKHGNLVPSKAMQAHKAGRGVYHSSYKNALRVAATETNMAYRRADGERWRGMPFALGVEVRTSINNHNPHPDMCDELEGVYPVDFDFVGWHPFCRCWAAPKLADRKEMEKYLDDLQDGKDVSDYQFTGRVEDVPQGFKDWVENNKARIEKSANLPYFIRDNYVDGDISKGFKFSPEQKQKEWRERLQKAAAQRHALRTPEQEAAIRQRWAERNAKLAAQNALTEAEKRAALIEKNAQELEKLMGVERGEPMTWEQADLSHSNPNYMNGHQWRVNCQTCVPTYELRRRGFDVVAMGADDGFNKIYKQGKIGYRDIFLNPDGSQVKLYWSDRWARDKGYTKMTKGRIEEFYKDMLRHEGRYEIRCGWKGQRVGHVFCADVDADGVIHWFDPQSGEHGEKMFKRYLESMDGKLCHVLRTDNKIINPNMARAFEKAKTLTPEQVFTRELAKAKTLEDLEAARKAYTGDFSVGSDMRKLWAEQRKNIRAATRTESEKQAIAARMEQRAKDIAAFDKFKATAGANIKANAGQLAWFDAKQLAELDKLQHRPLAYRAKAKEMAQQVAAIRKDIKELETLIPDVQTQWSKQFTSEELHGVFDSVKKKIAQIESAPLNTYKYTDHLDQQAAKYKFEIYDYLGGNMGGVQDKYKTWKVSQAAYTKQLEAVENKIWFKKAQAKITDLDALCQSHANSDKLKKFVDEAMDAYIAGDKTAFAAKAQEAESWAEHLDKLTAQRNARNARKKGVIVGKVDFARIPEKEREKLFADFLADTTDSADDWQRPVTKALWKTMTDEERILATKYTQTYHYVNEPLRGINYYGGRGKDEFINDRKVLTELFARNPTQKAMVVRRGTCDYPIPALGKNLSQLQVGDEFVDGAYLSTAVRVDKGFHMDYDMVIAVPKGAQGIYAEPFTHYNDHMRHDFETPSSIWEGETKDSFGNEREWIGQRGSKFRVVKIEGRRIYLEMIGQQYDQVADATQYIR